MELKTETMPQVRLIVLVAAALLTFLVGPAQGQTGPGGVGNANGSAGQPENVLWLEGGNGLSTSGPQVQGWADQSGNGNDVSSAGGSTAPGTAALQGVDAVSFDGANGDYLERAGATFLDGAGAVTMIAVVEADATGQDIAFLDSDADGPDNSDDAPGPRYDQTGFNSGRPEVVKFGVDVNGGGSEQSLESSQLVGGLAVQSTEARLYAMQWESGSDLRFFLNGLEDNATNGSSNAGDTANGPFLDGSPTSGALANANRILLGNGTKGGLGSQGWDGSIAEVIVFRSSLNAAERRVVNTYLVEKYGLTTGSGAEAEDFAYTTGFFEDFAGIGQAADGTQHEEAASAALQLQLRSGAANGDFVFFGHNGAAFSFSTNERPNSDATAQKVEREWRVDLKGASSQTVDVTVDIASLSLPGAANDYALFVDADGDFTSGAQHYDLDSNGSASEISLDDGDHVTLAAVQRTIQFATATDQAFENAGGNSPGDEFSPALTVSLNYGTSTPITVSYDVSEETTTLEEDTDGAFDAGEDYRGPGVSSPSFTIPGGQRSADLNAGGAALEVLNDSRDAQTDADESSPETLDITLTGTSAGDLTIGGTSTLSFNINDDDDPRKISFSGGGTGKPVTLLGTNPQEATDANGDNQSGEEGDVTTVTFEVALPEGVEGSASTVAVFEVRGADADDFDIPDSPTQTRLTDRRGEAQVGTNRSVDGPDPDSSPSSTGYGTFEITIPDDAVFEPDETITVEIVTARSGAPDPDPAADLDLGYMILNDDPEPTVSFATASGGGNESTSPATATLQLSGTADVDLDVDFSVGGTATASDYTVLTTRPVTIPAGQTSRSIEVAVVNDTDAEIAETIELSILDNGATEPTVGTPSTFVYTITDDDGIGSTGPGGVGSDLTNVLWLRADAINNLVDGDPLGSWIDASGNGHDLTAASSPLFNGPGSTNAINGRAVASFSGGEYLEDPDGDAYLNGVSAFSLFSVIRSSTTNADAGYFDTQGTGNGRDDELAIRYDDQGANSGRDNIIKIGLGNETQQLESSAEFGPNNNLTPTQQTEPQIHQVRWSSGADLTFALNGEEDNDADLNGSALSGSLTGVNTVEVGRGPKWSGGSAGWDGQVAEVIVYNTSLNETARTIVQNYLSAKYDIALISGSGNGNGGGNGNGNGQPTRTPDVYSGDEAGNGEYDRGVFGIGRISESDLHPAAEADGLRFDNPTGLQNDEFLLAGYKEAGNGINTTTSQLPGTVSARMERTWYVDVTGDGGNLTTDVTFDLSDAGLPSTIDPNPSGYRLLYRAGQTGAWSLVASSATVSSTDRITFSSVDIGAEGDGYYTLGTANETLSPLSGTAITITGTEGNEGNASSGTLGGDAGWRLIGSPVTGATAGNLVSGSDPNGSVIEFGLPAPMFYRWDDTAPSSESSNPGNWVEVGSAGDDVENGRGYLLFLFDDEGSADADPLDPDLTLDVAAGSVPDPATDIPVPGLNQSARFHVLANPYNQPFDLSSLEQSANGLGSGGTDFQTTVQIWDGGATTAEDGAQAGTYLDVGVNDVVDSGSPAMVVDGDIVSAWQGFVVERTSPGSGSTQLTFSSNGTTTGTRTIVGSKSQGVESQPASARIGLRMTVSDDSGRQIARDQASSIHFHPDATMGWDAFDASKLQPLAGRYAVIGPVGRARGDTVRMKAVESRPRRLEEPVDIPLRLETVGDVSGQAEVGVESWSGVPDGWTVTLIDTKSTPDPSDDAEQQLSPGRAYSFLLEAPEPRSGLNASETSRKSRTVAGERSVAPPRVAPLRTAGRGAADSTRAKSNTTVPSTRFRLRVEPSAALPVEFAGIEAVTKDRRVNLAWSTTSETNNAGFTVEHRRLRVNASGDTVRAGSWERLAFVEGSGTTNASRSYRYETNQLDYGPHAFRLRQVDTDGSTSLSDEVRTDIRLDRAYAVAPPRPHPVRRQTTIDVTVRNAQPVAVEVYDVLGRRVAVPFEEKIEGQQTRRIRVDASGLSSGVYFVRVRGDSFATTERMTVVK